MWYFILAFLLYFQNGLCALWPKGVVHFTINKKDYDLHSQDIILSTFADIEREICVKFFNTPPNFNATGTRILYISNPDKRKNCPPDTYNFTSDVIDMPIGYKCMNRKNIGRIVVDMLQASIKRSVPTINSFDLIRTFQEMNEDPSRPFLLNSNSRNFINAHYHTECGALSQRAPIETRRSSGALSMSEENVQFYKNKLWPLAILMYEVEQKLRNSNLHTQLKYAMTTIELASCVVFQEVRPDDALRPKSLLWFGSTGGEAPELGFKEGNQSVILESMIKGAPGHGAHTLNLLMRALGIPMASNRPDRDNHLNINWNNVEKGKEHYLEKYPIEGWLHDGNMPYDFDSATHAPANFVCQSCHQGETTVEPAQDHLWQRVMSMGHLAQLSEGDKQMIAVLYHTTCSDRLVSNNK